MLSENININIIILFCKTINLNYKILFLTTFLLYHDIEDCLFQVEEIPSQ